MSVKRWSDSGETYLDSAYRLRPGGRLRLRDEGFFEVVSTFLPEDPAPSRRGRSGRKMLCLLDATPTIRAQSGGERKLRSSAITRVFTEKRVGRAASRSSPSKGVSHRKAETAI